jgi:hypothetical protein
MTYLSSQPLLTNSWDDICYPVNPVHLTELLPDYDIVATDKQQLIVGEPFPGSKTIFGIQSGDYVIVPNMLIREAVDNLFENYDLQIKYTPTGEFSISIILPNQQNVGDEHLQRSVILTNSYNGKTPFTIQGKPVTAATEVSELPGSSLYREICQNGLMGWADSFGDLASYQSWLSERGLGGSDHQALAVRALKKKSAGRKIHNSRLTPELIGLQLEELLVGRKGKGASLTSTVYEHLQQKPAARLEEQILRSLPIPVQLAKQAFERLKFEQRMLGADANYWLMYNAVNHALFNARSSLTLNDRYKLDEQVFHQLAGQSLN